MWTPDAFEGAPAAAAALAGVASKVAVALALLRLSFGAPWAEPLWSTDRALLLRCAAAIVVLGVSPQTLAGVAAVLLDKPPPG